MLVSTQTVHTPSVKCLIKLWAERYTPQVSALPNHDPVFQSELQKAATAEGRAATVAKLHRSCVDINCQFATIQARALHEYIPNVMNLKEARRITEYASQIYRQLLALYQQSEAIASTVTTRLHVVSQSAPPVWYLPNVEALANALEPVLLEFQEQHIAASDWCTLGFITTQLNFSNKLLLQNLTPVEQVLIAPYFKFVEEQVALPWQRVCAAAAHYDLTSPAFLLVKQILPAAPQTAEAVYQKLLKRFPNHHSRRGSLNTPDVRHSCWRDLNMFQAYLCLCILQRSFAPVEQELAPLCMMVMPRVGVKWELVGAWNQLLMAELLHSVSPELRSLLLPYAEGIKRMFYDKRLHMGIAS